MEGLLKGWIIKWVEYQVDGLEQVLHRILIELVELIRNQIKSWKSKKSRKCIKSKETRKSTKSRKFNPVNNERMVTRPTSVHLLVHPAMSFLFCIVFFFFDSNRWRNQSSPEVSYEPLGFQRLPGITWNRIRYVEFKLKIQEFPPIQELDYVHGSNKKLEIQHQNSLISR